jgi:osmotically-inducible protein OsmY
MCPDLRLLNSLEKEPASDPVVDTKAANWVGNGGGDGVDVHNHPGAPRANTAAAGQGADDCSIGSRTDTDLMQSALSALTQNASVPVGKVRTVVRNAWLLLEGEVEAHIQRQAAEDAVKELPGIRGFSNNILIESEVMAQRVSRKIEEAFICTARLSASRVSVTASDHMIILCGSVHSRIESEEAEAAAWAVPGVAHVVNRIRAIR